MAKIGRGRPPIHTRFAKGQSGNPTGRPKGSKNVATIFMEAANDQVVATIDGKPQKITKTQATAMQLATKAASGDHPSIVKFLTFLDEIERRAAAARPPEFPFAEADLEVLQVIYQRMKQSKPTEA